MRSYLKESTFTLPDGETLIIRELSAGGRRTLTEAIKNKDAKPDGFLISALTVKAGTPSLSDVTVETLMDEQPAELLGEIAAEIMKLSGVSTDSEAQAEKN